ncbi:glutamate ABC transporter substrate-binding protein [Streptomyces sp. MZ04]|uniref:glutamate ABC transporter substrate-binding protein n=1 Tax=Streptomyces sp. MZ04 TaxID=2559236 RepID=UPI00107EB372|nr:glutamate ABC transporter substrate-binding protein [Streptomyces sp. MZ04]TGB09240.1 glutamate ABC transporter substrate-binding protein [Streptomyces sp. MZ04]
MRTRGTARLRGWGGAAAMAVACALTGSLVLVLPEAGGAARDDDGASRAGQGSAAAAPARAEECEKPEASLSPDDKDGPTIDAIRARKVKKLIIGVDQNSYRWGYRDPNKKTATLEGFDIDLAHKIAEEILGDRDAVLFRAIPTNQRVKAIQSGQVDMVVRTMTITCEREKEVAFSTAYFKTGQQVLAPKSSKITGFDDSLDGKRVCSAKGSTALTKLEELKKKGLDADIGTTVPNQLDCLVRLQLGEVDAVVTDSALAASQAAQDPTVELKGDAPLNTEYYGVAMKKPEKGADDLVRRVNQVLEDYRKDKDNGWRKSYDDWLEPALGTSAGPPAPTYTD